MSGVGHVIQVIAGYGQYWTEVKSGDPGFVQCVELRQVHRSDLALVVSPAAFDARHEGRDRSPKVDHQVGGREKLSQHFVKFPVGAVITGVDQALPVKVMSEDLSVFVNAAILNGRSWVVEQLAVGAQPVGEEENLRMKGPGAHIGIEIYEVRVFGHRLIEWLPSQRVG